MSKQLKDSQTTKIIIAALREIAIGRMDNGRPLAAEISREKARLALNTVGLPWSGDNP